MSKDLKRVAGIIGVVALGIATWGVGSLVAGGASFGSAVGGGITFGGAFSLSFGTIAQIGAGLLAVATAPETPSLEETGAATRGTAQIDPNALFVYAFGRTIVPSHLVYEEIVGSAPSREIHAVAAHCYHRIEQYRSLKLPTSDAVATVTFTGETADAPFDGLIWWTTADGTQSQSLQDTHTNSVFDGSSWPSSAVGENVAHSYLVFAPDKDAWREKFTAVPRKREIEVDGAWLYDPRLDPDHGSGSQDFDDPSTWSFNNGNAALVALRYARGEYNSDGDLLWGRGAPESDIDMDTFVSMANVADETVDSKPRFRLGGIFQLSGDWDEFARRWEEETGGKIYRSGGRIACWLPHDDLTALTTITEDDLVTEEAVAHEAANDIQRWFNTARGRYIEPDDGYRGKPYPEVEESTAVTTDGSRRILYRDFSWIQDKSIAERIARILVRRSRFQRVWVVGMGWKGQGPNYAPFTIHNLNLLETNETNVLVRVIDRRESLMSGLTVLTLQEEDASIYDDTLPLGTAFDSNTSPARSDPISLGTIRTIADGAVGRQAAEVIFEQATLPSSPEPRQLVYLTSADGGFNADTWVVRNSANTAWIKVGAHDALELINGPNEAGADQTALHANGLDNPEFEAGDVAWGGSNVWSVVQDATNARRGSWCAKATSAPEFARLANDSRLQVAPGDRVLAQCHGKVLSGSGSIATRLRWRDSSDSDISFDLANTVSSSSYDLSRVVAIAPANAVSVIFEIRVWDDSVTEGYADGCFAAIIPRDADIDALQTTNPPAAAGADVTAPKVGVRKNKDGLTTTEAYSGFIHGFDSAGNPSDTDAQFEVDGQLVSLSRAQFASGATYKMGNNGGEQQGFIIWDTANSDPFTFDGESVSVAFAKYFGGTTGWFYSGGANGFNGDGVSFTPTDDMVAIGTTRSRNGAGGITQASLFSSPLVVQGLFSDGADVTGDHTAADVTPETGTDSGTLSGFTTTVNVTWDYERTGSIVVLRLSGSSATGTSNAQQMVYSTLATALRPSSNRTAFVWDVIDGGISLLGRAVVTSSGTISFTRSSVATAPNADGVQFRNFDTSGTKGIGAGLEVTYALES